MTRIVSGHARGRQLRVPAKGTRPTSDRAREALFSSLDALLDLDGARVLDLFAGTGAIGLEALSRGAAQVVLVDSGREAAIAMRANIDVVSLPGARVRQQSVESYLAVVPVGAPPAGVDGPFDLVFADPPYAYPATALAAVLDQLGARLAAAALVVVERSARDAEPTWPSLIQPIKKRRYGDSVLWYGRRD